MSIQKQPNSQLNSCLHVSYICLGSLLSQAESLIPNFLNEEDVQLLRWLNLVHVLLIHEMLGKLLINNIAFEEFQGMFAKLTFECSSSSLIIA